MGLDSMTNNTMHASHIFEFPLVVIYMDLFDGAWEHYQQGHGSLVYIGMQARGHWQLCLWWGLATLPKMPWISNEYLKFALLWLPRMFLIGLDTIAIRGQGSLTYILEFCFVIIDMDVSDGGWTAFLKMPWIFYMHIGFGPCDNWHWCLWLGLAALPKTQCFSYVYWNCALWWLTCVFLMALGGNTKSNGSLTCIGIRLCENWMGVCDGAGHNYQQSVDGHCRDGRHGRHGRHGKFSHQQKASRCFEPRSLDSESRVLTVTP